LPNREWCCRHIDRIAKSRLYVPLIVPWTSLAFSLTAFQIVMLVSHRQRLCERSRMSPRHSSITRV
jgi:hypothetical protein